MKLENWEKKLEAEVFLKQEMAKKIGNVMSDKVMCDSKDGDKSRVGAEESQSMSQVRIKQIHERHTQDKQSNDKQTLERAMAAGLKDSRFASWSRRGKCALVLLRETTPKFSMSDMVAEYLEQGLERDHPELMKIVDEYLKTQI